MSALHAYRMNMRADGRQNLAVRLTELKRATDQDKCESGNSEPTPWSPNLARSKTAFGSSFMPRSSRPRSNEGYCHAPA
jgi:hypothetical protein